MKKIGTILLGVLTLISLVGCESKAKFMKDSDMKKVEKNPTGVITLDVGGTTETLEYELYYDKAPITVTNFISLVKDGFYNDTIIHETKDSTIFMGGYKYIENDDGKEEKKAQELKYTIAGEFKANDWSKNDLKAESGSMYMGQTGEYNSASSIFGIIRSDYTVKDFAENEKVAFFGKVTDTTTLQAVIRNIIQESGNSSFRVTIKGITVDTFGVDFGKPWTIKK